MVVDVPPQDSMVPNSDQDMWHGTPSGVKKPSSNMLNATSPASYSCTLLVTQTGNLVFSCGHVNKRALRVRKLIKMRNEGVSHRESATILKKNESMQQVLHHIYA